MLHKQSDKIEFVVHRISFVNNRVSFRCRSDQAVLLAMCGTADRCIPVGCRSGGCGVCRVRVVSGEYETGAMSAAHISESDRADGQVLSCQLLPRSDLELKILGPQATDDDHPYRNILDMMREKQASMNK